MGSIREISGKDGWPLNWRNGSIAHGPGCDPLCSAWFHLLGR